MEKQHKIAVIGGTGKTGTVLVNQLIREGYQVRLLVRNTEFEQKDTHSIEKVHGDAGDYPTILELIRGCDAVISTIGQRKGERLIHSLASTNIIEAMKALGIRRYIVITGLTLNTAFDKKGFKTRLLSKMMRMSFPDIIADKEREYAIVSESGLDWTVVRLPRILPAGSLGDVRTSLTDCPGSRISTKNLVTFLIGQLSDDSFIRKAPFAAN